MFPPCQWFEKLPNYHIPEFQSNASEFHVILWILKFENEVIEEITPDDTPFIQEFVQANPQIYKLISQNPQVNAVQMSESMGVSRRQVQKHLKRLQELKKIARVGGHKIGKWKIIDEDYMEFFNRI